MSRVNLLEFHFEDNIVSKIFSEYGLLTREGGEEDGCVIGGWGGQML